MDASDGHTGTRDDLLIVALARGATYAAAGATAGMSESTVRRRMADDEFRRRVSRLRGELVDAACGQAAAALSGAMTTLVRLLESANDSVALGAARSLVDCAVRLREASELEQRVVELERVAEGVAVGLRAVR